MMNANSRDWTPVSCRTKFSSGAGAFTMHLIAYGQLSPAGRTLKFVGIENNGSRSPLDRRRVVFGGTPPPSETITRKMSLAAE
jgi:hypothetical protein